jgi:polyisoprenoid-binding protein YceI
MTLSKTLALTAVAALLAAAPMTYAKAPVHAAKPAAAAAVQGGTFAVEPNHTRVLFSVSHLGFSTWYGDFTHASGELKLDPKNLAATKLSVSVPMNSIATTNATLDGELKADDWFDAAKYPTATFVSRKVTRKDARHADILGDLTLHGVTRPVVLHAVFNGAGVNVMSKAYTVGFDAHGTIKRSDFGVTKYLPLIGDNVELILSGAFERKAG